MTGSFAIAAIAVVLAGQAVAADPPRPDRPDDAKRVDAITAQIKSIARQGDVTGAAVELLKEVGQASPALVQGVDWNRLTLSLAESVGKPTPALARATLMCQVYNLGATAWPVEQRLALLREYIKDPAVNVRRLAVNLLSRPAVAKAGGLADLKKIAAADADPGVKMLAAKELLRNGDPAGWEPTLRALYSDDANVRAQKALQASPNREAKDALIELSLGDWKFGANAARLPDSLKLTPTVVELAKKCFAMADNVVRRTIVEIIGLNRDKSLLPVLEERLEKEDAWTVHRSLYVAMGYLGDASAIPLMLDGFARPKAARSGRQPPAVGLALLGDVKGVQSLVELLAKGEQLPVLATALTRAFDPSFGNAGGEGEDDEAEMFLVPDKAGRMKPAWIPAASYGLAPTIDDGKGGRVRAAEMTAADVHAAWAAFLKDFGGTLKWDAGRCCFVVAAK